MIKKICNAFISSSSGIHNCTKSHINVFDWPDLVHVMMLNNCMAATSYEAFRQLPDNPKSGAKFFQYFIPQRNALFSVKNSDGF